MTVKVGYVLLISALEALAFQPPTEVDMSPSGYTAVSINSTVLTHFHCQVRGGEAFWEIRGHQFQDRDQYYSRGVVIDVSDNLTYTNLTLSKAGLDLFRLDMLPIRCYKSLGISVPPVYSDSSYIIRYGSPEAPLNVRLIPTPSLHLSWQPPGNLHQAVPVEYAVEVINLSTMSVVQQNTTTELTMEILQPTSQLSCEPHSIGVKAMTDAGNSTDVTITESIPFSPDVSPISKTLTVDSIELINGNYITISISFKGTKECGDNYPILNYTVKVKEFPSSKMDINHSAVFYRVPLTPNEFPGLAMDMKYTAYIIACTSITCRQSDGVDIYTSNLQSASVTFTHTDVYLSCTLISGSSASGCNFVFSLANTTQVFNISLSDQNMCFPTHNQRDAYTDIEVSAVDRDGRLIGMALVPNITEDDSLSGCSNTEASANDLTPGATAAAIATPTIAVIVGAAFIVFSIYIVWRQKKIKVGKGTTLTLAAAAAAEPPQPIDHDEIDGGECTDGGYMNQESCIGLVTVIKKGQLQIQLYDTLEAITDRMKENSSLEIFVKNTM